MADLKAGEFKSGSERSTLSSGCIESGNDNGN
jgi:hypothetical protein